MMSLVMNLLIKLLIINLFTVVHAHSQFVVGSKKFTESVILGDMITLSLQQKDLHTKHMAEIGGSTILWKALLAGDIDIYPEYTGTIQEELLKGKVDNFNDLREALAAQGIGITEPLGFNNTYALGMTKERARVLGISKISDLVLFPQLKIGWSEEFQHRQDGWPGLKEKYHLPQGKVRALDHDVAYRALDEGDIDIMDLYSTDAEIQHYDLVILDDDRHYFPRYDAVYLYRLAAAALEPKFKESLTQLEGKITESSMVKMNAQAKIDKAPSRDVAAGFLRDHFSFKIEKKTEHVFEQITLRTKEHLTLVFISLFFAILVAIPLGLLAAKKAGMGSALLWLVGGIQTIPSLALLVILIQPLNQLGLKGIGTTPALIALFLYSLLPIVRGSHSGFSQIPQDLRETAEVIGLSSFTRLFRVELPLALPSILSGIKTAAVMNVGFATLGALVGAGGYGQPILAGIRLDDYGLILQGAIPSALLALAVQLLFDLAERYLVSPGIRN